MERQKVSLKEGMVIQKYFSPEAKLTDAKNDASQERIGEMKNNF